MYTAMCVSADTCARVHICRSALIGTYIYMFETVSLFIAAYARLADL